MEGEFMDKKEAIKEFKEFLNANRENLLKYAVDIKDLPEDDEWLQDDEWDKIYEQEVIKNERIMEVNDEIVAFVKKKLCV